MHNEIKQFQFKWVRGIFMRKIDEEKNTINSLF